MRLYGTACLGLFMLSMLSFGQISAEPSEKTGVVLFTHEEAEQLRLTEQEWRQHSPRTRAVFLGPKIVVQTPLVKETNGGHEIHTTTPTDLFVSFAETRAPVDMSSLEVCARKGFFSKSLTSLLRPHVEGTTLQVSGVEVPVGYFLLDISIADANGVKTVEMYRLTVGKP